MFKLHNIIIELKSKLECINKELSMYIACFTGYRPNKCPWGYNEQDERCIDMKRRTRVKVENAIKQGYHTFLCGMAVGFDMICAEIVLELKKIYPHIKLIGALPCRNQYCKWNSKQQERYINIIKQLDDVRCIYDTYIDGCMQERNEYMVNNSSLVISLFDGKSGGTKQTLEHAKKQGLRIEVIKP